MSMVIGSKQSPSRRQRSGVGWLFDKWLAYSQAEQCVPTTNGLDQK
jgi:hypothetical protein